MILESAKIFLFRIYQIGVGMVIAAILARFLGSTAYGDYIFVMTIVSTVVIPVQFGVSQLITRETARPTMKDGFHRWALGIVLVWTVFGSVALMGSLLALDSPPARNIKDLAPISIVTLGCLTIMYFLAALLAGQSRTEKEQLYQNVLRPTAFLFVLAVFLVFPGRDKISAQLTFTAHLISVLLVLVMLAFSVREHVNLRHKNVPREVKSHWLRSVLYFIAIGGIDVLLQSADILMLGTIVANEDVAVYRIGAVMAGILSLPLSAVSTHAAPRIAAADEPEAIAQMQGRSIQLARISFVVTLVLLAAAIGLGRPVILLVFGADYSGSYAIMLVLGVASVFNVIMGLNRLVLTSQGHERVVFLALGWSSVLNVALNLVLIPKYQAVGAAVATAISVIVWNVWLHFKCYQVLGYGVAIISRPLAVSQQPSSDES